MMYSILRCPMSFFDRTSSGEIISKFSNDLGILDSTLAFTFVDVIEGIIITLVMMANIFQINVLFIPFGIINVVFLAWFLWFCKKSIILTKQLDLRAKSPAFNTFNEATSSLAQIRIFNYRGNMLRQFSKIVNNMSRANLAYWNCSRAFGANVCYFSILILIMGYVIGVHETSVYPITQISSAPFESYCDLPEIFVLFKICLTY